METYCPSETYLVAGLRNREVLNADGTIRKDAPKIFIEEAHGIGLSSEGYFEGVTPEGEIQLRGVHTRFQFPVNLGTYKVK